MPNGEACEAYIKSQVHEGWQLIPNHYYDGAFSGASLDRPDLQRLVGDIAAGRVDNVVVYKVDRLTRSLTDFARLVDLFDENGVSLSRSPKPSTPPPAWAGSPSMFFCLLPNSSRK
jgi:DNA invertase Pin-like site-specific DNA recombinase